MFGLSNAGEYAGAIESEFIHLISKLRRLWLTEHKEDGSHAAITGDSITLVANETSGATGDVIAGGDGTFDGNVTADADDTPVEIGKNIGLAGTFDAPGIRMSNTTPVVGSDWSIVSAFSPVPGEQSSLVFQDMLNVAAAGTTGVMVFGRTTNIGVINAEYNLIPTSVVVSLHLGINSPGFRWSSVNCNTLTASTQIFERLRSVALGEWTTPTFAAGNFTGTGGTWTVASGDAITYAYTRVGTTMTVSWNIETTAVGAGPVAELNIAIPGGATAAKTMFGLYQALDNGAAAVGVARVVATETIIRLQSTVVGAGWADTGGATTTTVRGQLTFETTT
jgi:hypothetical protein